MIYFLAPPPWKGMMGAITIGTATRIAMGLDNAMRGRRDPKQPVWFREHRKTLMRVLAMMDGSAAEARAIRARFGHLLVAAPPLGEMSPRLRRSLVLPNATLEAIVFKPGPDLLAFIAEHGRPWDGEDAAQLGIERPKPPAAQTSLAPTAEGLAGRLAGRRGRRGG